MPLATGDLRRLKCNSSISSECQTRSIRARSLTSVARLLAALSDRSSMMLPQQLFAEALTKRTPALCNHRRFILMEQFGQVRQSELNVAALAQGFSKRMASSTHAQTCKARAHCLRIPKTFCWPFIPVHPPLRLGRPLGPDRHCLIVPLSPGSIFPKEKKKTKPKK